MAYALMRVAFVPIRLLWQRLECVLWWWARQCPLQCIRKLVPWVVLSDLAAPLQRVNHHTDEEQERREGQEPTH